jgi:hypothetical protein
MQTTTGNVPQIERSLERWYAAQSSIRRVWALDDPDALLIFVAIEPTADGDDALPVWLAKKDEWIRDLQSLFAREVRLQLVAPGAIEESPVGIGTTVIAELSWRDSWHSGM